ncbi:kinase-like domain-containing protein [Xylariaceae sp. FL0594]|nr:kinase-like domain-containing protein [Xylariaceae sp. FL0594]
MNGTISISIRRPMLPKQENNQAVAPKWTISTDAKLQAQVNNCFGRTNWEAICKTASRVNGGQPCKALPYYTHGGSSLVRLLEFEDGTRWIARVQLLKSTPNTAHKIQAEIDTIALLKAQTKTPTPQVFGFELGDENPAGVSFVLFEYFPGNSALDEARDYNRIDWSLIPFQYRQTFYRSIAAAHVQISSARLPKIGTVTRSIGGDFTVGPIPGIGGPFETAASFMLAWAARVQFPYQEEYLRKCVPPSQIDDILKGVDEFSDRLAKLVASGKYFTCKGPFPLRHADLFYNNIIVSKSFEVLGIIDWEGACTVPWELVDAPCFLSSVPRLLNPPGQYDESGQPLDQSEANRWADEQAYASIVREVEHHAKVDQKLSAMLLDKDTRDLASMIHLFAQGKMGFYSSALDYFENKLGASAEDK